MIGAPEFHQLTPHLAFWHAYDPHAKAELFSTAVATGHGTLLIDPILLTEPALSDLLHHQPAVGVIVTNINHARAVADLAIRFSVPVFAHPDAFGGDGGSHFTPVTHGSRILEALDVVVIEGAAAGEIALHHQENHGSLILGDALINFDPHGFTYLPRKYCSDQKQMRRSLRQLLKFKSERMLFAHGTPIIHQASLRLEQLLERES